MEFDVTATLDGISFHPASTLEEILQNVRTIVSTAKYSVPLDRNFGVTATMLDSPMPTAQAKLNVEIIATIQRYEPRVRVTDVSYEGDGMDGILRPKVKVKIIE